MRMLSPTALMLGIYQLVLLLNSIVSDTYAASPFDEVFTLLLLPAAIMALRWKVVVNAWLWFFAYAALVLISVPFANYGGVPQPISAFYDVALDCKLPILFFGFLFLLVKDRDIEKTLADVCLVFVAFALLNAPFVLRDVFAGGVGIHGQPLTPRMGGFQPHGLYYHHVDSCWRSLIGVLCAAYLYKQRRSMRGLLAILLLTAVTLVHLSTKESVIVILALMLAMHGGRISFSTLLPSLLSGLSVFSLILFLSPLGDLVLMQYMNYFGADAYEGQARTMLGLQSFHIANDNFPLGAGGGTYASPPSFQFGYSDVYYAYGLDRVWGASPDAPNFILDVFWPKILAESGWIGLFFFIGFMWQLFKWSVHAYTRRSSPASWLSFSVCMACVLISLAACPYSQEFVVVVVAYFGAYAAAIFLRENLMSGGRYGGAS